MTWPHSWQKSWSRWPYSSLLFASHSVPAFTSSCLVVGHFGFLILQYETTSPTPVIFSRALVTVTSLFPVILHTPSHLHRWRLHKSCRTHHCVFRDQRTKITKSAFAWNLEINHRSNTPLKGKKPLWPTQGFACPRAVLSSCVSVPLCQPRAVPYSRSTPEAREGKASSSEQSHALSPPTQMTPLRGHQLGPRRKREDSARRWSLEKWVFLPPRFPQDKLHSVCWKQIRSFTLITLGKLSNILPKILREKTLEWQLHIQDHLRAAKKRKKKKSVWKCQKQWGKQPNGNVNSKEIHLREICA